jgi:hypothetical protein
MVYFPLAAAAVPEEEDADEEKVDRKPERSRHVGARVAETTMQVVGNTQHPRPGKPHPSLPATRTFVSWCGRYFDTSAHVSIADMMHDRLMQLFRRGVELFLGSSQDRLNPERCRISKSIETGSVLGARAWDHDASSSQWTSLPLVNSSRRWD